MKKLLLVVPLVLTFSFAYAPESLSKQERKFAIKFLKDSEKNLEHAIRGLSASQLSFKPSEDSWSIEETIKHIAVSEENLWNMVDGTIKQPANPEKRANIKMNDEQLIAMMENRSQKFKTSENFEPKNTKYANASVALDEFRMNRSKLIAYMKSTNDDLRNHVATTPAGEFDSYQMTLFIGSHTNRHRLQIEEIKMNENFPKN